MLYFFGKNNRTCISWRKTESETINIFSCLPNDIFPASSRADYTLIDSKNLTQIFQRSDKTISWVESTESNRAILWYYTILDILSYDPLFDMKDNEEPVFFITRYNLKYHMKS